MKDMNVKRTVSLSEEEMKEVLGGDTAIYQLHCQQMEGGVGCTGYCEPKYDFQHGGTKPQTCMSIGKTPPNPDGIKMDMCDCV